MTLNEFVNLHRSSDDGLRLGQRFVNTYVKGQFPILFFQESDAKALAGIKQYLADYQYGNDMPTEVKRSNTSW